MRNVTLTLLLVSSVATAAPELTLEQNMASIRSDSAKVTEVVVKAMCRYHPNPERCMPVAEAMVNVLRSDERNRYDAERAYREILDSVPVRDQ